MDGTLNGEQLKGAHGGQGSEEKSYTRLLDKDSYETLRFVGHDPDAIIEIIAGTMSQGDDDLSDAPDDQENPYVPAGYTYFGQFVDHDLTLDTRSTLETLSQLGLSSLPDNLRTPRLDLDCLYGLGPDAAPYMYDMDGRLLTNESATYDLPRSSVKYDPNDQLSHRAIIGDPRNDENSIVCQLQLAFIHFHNRMIDYFLEKGLKGKELFNSARKEVRFTYQKIIVTDFLKRIVSKGVYDEFVTDYARSGGDAFRLYKRGPKREALPLEFTAAAYRFGHSGVRNGYRLNSEFQKKIFNESNSAEDSLVGFGDLPESHKIDWKLFLSPEQKPGTKAENTNSGKGRLQFAYKLDTTLVEPLRMLPPRIAGTAADKPPASIFRSLAARNIKRGYNFSLPSGQDVAARLGIVKHPPLMIGERLLTFDKMPGLPADAAERLSSKTPLWIYVLAEAQAMLLNGRPDFQTKQQTTPDGGSVTVIDKNSNDGTQLGPVGGRIVLEVFYGILEDDPDSYFNVDPNKPWSAVVQPGEDTVTLWDLLAFAGAIK